MKQIRAPGAHDFHRAYPEQVAEWRMKCDDDETAFERRFVEGSAYDREAKQHAIAEEAGKPDHHRVFPRSAEKKPCAKYPQDENG